LRLGRLGDFVVGNGLAEPSGGLNRADGRGKRGLSMVDVTDPEDDLRLGARAVNRFPRRELVPTGQPKFNTVTFGEVTPPSRKSAAFLLTARRRIGPGDDRRKSANHGGLRAARQVAALSVCNASIDGPSATPRVTIAPRPETLKLSPSLG